jgi:hypothetical protein
LGFEAGKKYFSQGLVDDIDAKHFCGEWLFGWTKVWAKP